MDIITLSACTWQLLLRSRQREQAEFTERLSLVALKNLVAGEGFVLHRDLESRGLPPEVKSDLTSQIRPQS